MKATLILWTHNTLKNGQHPVKVRIQDGANKTVYKSTGKSVAKAFWKDGKVVKLPNAAALNRDLREILDQIESNYLEKGVADTGDSDNFLWWFERRIEQGRTKHSYYHTRKMNTVLNKLKEFRSEVKIKHINTVYLRDLETWMRGKGHHQNYISDTLIRIKVVVKELVNSGHIKYHENPFLSYHVKKVRIEKQRLTLEDIEKLKGISLKGEGAKVARDMYLFSFYCAGIRFGDMCRMKHSNVIDGRLIYEMRKTLKPRSIKLNKFALEIIKRQKTKGYIFNTRVDWTNPDQSINSRNAFYNQRLHEMCKKLKIPEITFHTSRNSFADLAIGKKIDAHKLKEMLGHSKIATTEIYMKDFYREETDEAMDQIFGG